MINNFSKIIYILIVLNNTLSLLGHKRWGWDLCFISALQFLISLVFGNLFMEAIIHKKIITRHDGVINFGERPYKYSFNLGLFFLAFMFSLCFPWFIKLS